MLMVVVPALAMARPPPRGQERLEQREDDEGGPPERGERMEDRRERRQRAKKEMELRRTLRIADEVGLDEGQTLKVSEMLKAGDEKRNVAQEQIKSAVEQLREISKGAPSAKDVDGKIKEIQDLRARMLALEVETLNNAAKGLAPHQKAKLALVLGVHERQMRAMMFQEHGRGDDPNAPQPPQPPSTP
jgi:hypothetical protein